MTDSSDARLEAVLRELRLQYLADSPARVAELREDLARVERGEGDALDALRRRFHKLAGSGGSYGVPEVTERSRAAEHAAQALLQSGAVPDAAALAELQRHVQQVADAFASASAGPPDPGGP